jgi:hypothetical protein
MEFSSQGKSKESNKENEPVSQERQSFPHFVYGSLKEGFSKGVQYDKSELKFDTTTEKPGSKNNSLNPTRAAPLRKSLSNLSQNYKLVYQYHSPVAHTAEKSKTGILPALGSRYAGKGSFWTPDLCFDSHFESGNLEMAYRTSLPNDYLLFLRSDEGKINTLWFYFQVCTFVSPL